MCNCSCNCNDGDSKMERCDCAEYLRSVRESGKCICHDVEAAIRRENPDCNWKMDKASREWNFASYLMQDNGFMHPENSEEFYLCKCPTCGRIICDWSATGAYRS